MGGKVPETILKKRRRNDEWAAKKAAEAAEASKKAKATRQLTFKKAQAYAKEYLQQVRGCTACGLDNGGCTGFSEPAAPSHHR